MNRYFLEVSYMGTHYSGFQVQANAVTVQSTVEQALRTVTRREISLTGSSRTDAGVHARQNFFHFDTDILFSSKQLYNLNAVLPPDIAVSALRPVGEQAHCRFDALSRSYSYLVYREKDPFIRELGYYFPYKVDIDALQAAAREILGTHDFTSFSKRNTQVRTFICTITESRWEKQDSRLEFRVTGNRFLRGMVRGLVGTMLKVGTGRLTVEGFRSIIESRDCKLADFSVPGRGLCLERVLFPKDVGIASG